MYEDNISLNAKTEKVRWIGEICRSKTKIKILYAIEEHPRSSANRLRKYIECSSTSQVYKATKSLAKLGVINWHPHGFCVITRRGKALLNLLDSVALIPAEVPTVELNYKW